MRMSEFEQSVFNLVQSHPVWGVGMIAYCLGCSLEEVRGVVNALSQRGVLSSGAL